MVLKDANKGTNTIIISFCVIMSSFGILILSIYFLPWSLTAIPGVGQPLYPSPVSGGGSTVTTIHTLEFNYFALIDLVSTLQSDYSITPSNYVPDPHWVGGSALYPITEGDSISADTTYFMLFLGIAMVVQFADWGWDLAEGGVPINTVTLLALAIPFFLFLASKTVYVDVAVAGILIALISSFIDISEIKLSRLFYS